MSSLLSVPNRGMVLLYSLSVLVILATIGLSLQQTGSSIMAISKDVNYRSLAQQAADSGLRYGVGYVRGVLDPLAQYPAPYDTRWNQSVATIPQHGGITPTGMGGNYPPIHPCNVFWRLMPATASDIEPWFRGGPDLVLDLVTLSQRDLDPQVPVAAAAFPAYQTRFTLRIRAICARPTGMVGIGGQPGQLMAVGVRWEDLVDAVNEPFCHSCTLPPLMPAGTPSQVTPSYYPPTPLPATQGPTAACFGPVFLSAPATRAPTNTSQCAFAGRQPYLLTSIGDVRIGDPAAPTTLRPAPVAQITLRQVVMVSCRNPTAIGPPASTFTSTHSTYIVTALNAER